MDGSVKDVYANKYACTCADNLVCVHNCTDGVPSVTTMSAILIYRYTNLFLSSPAAVSTALSVTQSSHVTGRALLEYKEPPLYSQPTVSNTA